MRKTLAATFLVFATWMVPAASPGFPLNAKKAPASQADLIAIQDALGSAIPKAKKATVCIDLGEGTGSGVIVTPDGLVMSAAHVATGVGKDVTVIMPDGTELKAETLGLMAEVDAALVRITEKLPDDEPFPTVEINRTGDTKLGDWIFSSGTRGASTRIAVPSPDWGGWCGWRTRRSRRTAP